MKPKGGVYTVVKAVCDGFEYDPGHSDLDDEQPIQVSMPLGTYRLACRLEVILQFQEGR